MGYFKRPIRRGPARRARLALLEPARGIRPDDWRLCDPGVRPPVDSFLRFVIERPDGSRVGLFRWSRVVHESIDLSPAARSGLRAVFRWFDAHMRVPPGLPKNAVCWLRADAAELVERLRMLAEFYRLAGRPVWMLATRTPGRVVYRDEHQVAAVPYPDRRTTAGTL